MIGNVLHEGQLCSYKLIQVDNNLKALFMNGGIVHQKYASPKDLRFINVTHWNKYIPDSYYWNYNKGLGFCTEDAPLYNLDEEIIKNLIRAARHFASSYSREDSNIIDFFASFEKHIRSLPSS
ncbi:hypothetical protein Zmor_028530 [Zophobas morio]|uniref:Uncharacterized protein n=1 Tax=Zophobas morio TaxID=2755281 RepID=A0AA38M070_9CUCU|nr:hypothetical protein Zmor_028530 [Zophobas morio]